MISTYPEHPGAKVSGASQDAAEAITEHALTLRERVDQLFVLGSELTADECAERLQASVLAVRPRLSELKTLGRIIETGFRRKNLSGLSATVWKTTAQLKQPDLWQQAGR
jgi:predicted ArsR family transcriptional regulator